MDATSSKDRGVAIFIKNNLSAKITEIPEIRLISNNIELICVKVQYKKLKSFLICSVYRHPNYTSNILQDDYEALEELCAKLCSYNLTFFLFGDFNLRDKKSIFPLNTILKTKNLTQIIDIPTRANNLLDLIITNNVNIIVHKDVLNPLISDHCLTECKIKFCKMEKEKFRIVYRNLNSLNIKQFYESLDLSAISQENNANECTTRLITSITKSLDILAPYLSKLIVKYPTKKYLSPETKQLLKQKDSIYKLIKSNQLKYRVLNDNLKVMQRNLKKSIYNDTKIQWETTVEKLNIWNSLKKLYPLVNPTKQAINIPPNEINKFFVNISTRDINEPLPLMPNIPLSNWTDIEHFKFRELTSSDIQKAWKTTKNKKSTNPDVTGLPNYIIDSLIGLDSFIDKITLLFNAYINEEVIPPCLKVSRIVPIPKIVNPKDPNDLRPISIQPNLAKLFGKCIYEQLTEHLEINNLLSQYQFGARKHHSTSHALIAITDYMYEAISKGNVCVLVTLDIKKAYDKTCREILLHKLKWYGIDSKLIESFLSDRTQFVASDCNQCPHHINNTLPTNLGIPQGLCLSCLLFLIIMNDLPTHIKNSLTIMFVDDTGLIISGEISKINELVDALESDLTSIYNWMINSRLQLNEEKCKFMVICKKRTVPTINIKLNGKNMNQVSEIKILGLLIDDKLNFVKHSKHVSSQCHRALWSLSPLRIILCTKTKRMLICALVFSILNYVSCIWMRTKANQETAYKVIRACTRFICNKAKYDSICDIINVDLEFLHPKYLYQYELLKIAYKININECPKYFINYFSNNDCHTVITRKKSYVSNMNGSANNMLRNSFKIKASELWSNLPNSIIDVIPLISFKTFKKLIFSHLLNQQQTARMYDIFNEIDDYEFDILYNQKL